MRRYIVPSLTAALVLAFTAAAAAEGSGAKAGGGSSTVKTTTTTTTVPEPFPATSATETTTSGEATATTPPAVDAKTEARLQAIRDRADKMPATERVDSDKKVEENVKDVNVEAVTNGDATVADRFAAEFGITSEGLLAERTQYGVGWGELMVVHTLLASAPNGTTADNLYTLHADGMGWGQIAYGLGLRAASVAAAMKTETQVARGTLKADGKAAKIGSSTRVASAGTTAGGKEHK